MPVTKKSPRVLRQDKVSPIKPASFGLSKSRFCLGVQCLKALYLRVHEPDLAAPVDEAQQMIFDQGTEVGEEARKRYPGGELISVDHFHSDEALEATQKAILRDPPAIFEAAFAFHRTLVRIDILKNNGDGSWDIIEVKSSTDLKDEHIPDVAIQRYVAEKAGLKVARTYLKHINRECIYPNLEDLFLDVDCTERVQEEIKTVAQRIDEMLVTLESEAPPKKDIGPHCDTPYECAFKDKCWEHIPENSVFELNGVWDKTKFDLYHRGLIQIKDIPENEKVSRAKVQQLKAVRTGTPVTDLKGLRGFLETIQYPAYFLDFETINPAIPQYDGLRPYSQVTFQFSCHIIEIEGGEVEHVEYLAEGTGDPRPGLADALLKVLGKDGTIVAYNQSFEKTRIEELARCFPSMANDLRELLSRFIDLKDAFSKHYYHPDFHGSFSIKDVLPVLVPDMTYEGMGVSDGGGAQAVYLKLCHPNTPSEERAKCKKDLLDYCKQDTLAMVELLKRVQAIAYEEAA